MRGGHRRPGAAVAGTRAGCAGRRPSRGALTGAAPLAVRSPPGNSGRRGVTIASFAATTLLGFAVMPSASWKYWTDTFFDTSRMFPIAEVQAWNHSPRGLIAPLANPAPGDLWFWLALSTVVGLAGLAVCGVTSLVVSPVSWPAQWCGACRCWWRWPVRRAVVWQARRSVWR
ncbi:MAG TPA: glycosyltransferase 87 family protein [Pseudonocardiaceae bacterium]